MGAMPPPRCPISVPGLPLLRRSADLARRPTGQPSHRLGPRLTRLVLAPATALAASLLLLSGCTAVAPTPQPPASGAGQLEAPSGPLRYLGQQILSTATVIDGIPFGGLSGIDCEPGTRRCVALSDDRANLGPARFYMLELDLAAFERRADAGSAGVRVVGTTPIGHPEGRDWAQGEPDPESIRIAAGGRVFWSDEGRRSAGRFLPPAVREIDREGRPVRSFGIPSHYLPTGTPRGDAPGDRGVRDNLAFESLTITPDGRRLWVATEGALVQDGPMPTLSAGTPVRMLAIDLNSAADGGRPGVEHAYVLEPVPLPPEPAGGPAGNGLVELLALDATRFIAVERSWARGAATPGNPRTGNTVRLFLVDTTGATDVSGMESLAGRDWVPVRKTLLLALNDLRHDDGTPLATDNIEGIAWGPLHQGRPTLVLVSDNNFNPRQFTQILALEVHGELAAAAPTGLPEVPSPKGRP
jgi:hypothetical protein